MELSGEGRGQMNTIVSSRSLCVILSMLLACLVALLLLGGLAVAAPDSPQRASIAHEQAISDIISEITTQTLAYELAGLTGERPVVVAGSLYTIATRNSYQTEAISMATRYVYEQLAGDDLSVAYHSYVWSGNRWRNVVAEKPGAVDPGAIYLITAHVDDLPAGELAPGADDNGSGSVAVLMAARLLESHHFAHTLRFVLFTGEEQGLRGSDAYAADCTAQGENVEGVINLDMIGFNSDAGRIIDLYAHTSVTASLELTRIFSDVIGVYGLDLVPNRFADISPIRASDQWSFLQQGYPAFLVIEDTDDFTPYYHTTSDKLSTLDLDYYADTTRASVAAIAHLGRLLPEGHLSGAVHALDTGRPLSDTAVVASCPAYRDLFTTTTDASGAYGSILPAGSYTITVHPSLAGYRPAIVTDVLVVTGAVVVQNFTLEPWTYLCYLPLIARER